MGIDYSSQTCKKAAWNMRSALEKPDIVRDYLAKECAGGRVVGPLESGEFPMVHVSRFGLIPKSTGG